MDKELLAIVDSVKAYTHYLYGTKFVIRCDNASLQKIKSLPDPPNRISRWFLFLAEYDYTFECIRGAENFAADIFSRDFHTLNAILRHVPDMQEIELEQGRDEKLSPIIEKLNSRTAILTAAEENYFMRNGILMHAAPFRRSIAFTNVEQICIPDNLKPYILANAHSPHLGFIKTYEKIKEKYFWQNLYADTKNYVESCQECMGFKTPRRYPDIPIQRHYIAYRPGQYVSMDFVGKLPRTGKNNQYILVFIDHFTRYMRAYPCENQTAETTAEKLFEYICQYGKMDYLLSDRGSNFTSHLFQETAKHLGIEKLFTTAYHPACNAINEISHKNLKKSLTILARDSLQWDNQIPQFELAYNNCIHSATGEKPSFLLYGQDIALPDMLLQQELTPDINSNLYPDYVQRRMEDSKKIKRVIRDNLITTAENTEEYQHRNSRYRNFYLGQLVFLHDPNLDRNCHLPKKRNYRGPYRIMEIHSLVNYSILELNNPKAKIQRVHSSRLLPFISRKENLESPSLIQPFLEQTGVKAKPFAVFDEPDNVNIQRYCYLQNTNTNTNDFPNQTSPTHSSDSQDTQIYTFDETVTTPKQLHTSEDPRQSTSRTLENAAGTSTINQSLPRYNLRPRTNTQELDQNLPTRVFNWLEQSTRPSGQTTKPKTNDSSILNFLDNIANRLAD